MLGVMGLRLPTHSPPFQMVHVGYICGIQCYYCTLGKCSAQYRALPAAVASGILGFLKKH